MEINTVLTEMLQHEKSLVATEYSKILTNIFYPRILKTLNHHNSVTERGRY